MTRRPAKRAQLSSIAPAADPPRVRVDGVVLAQLLALRADGKALVRVLSPEGLDPRLHQPIFAPHCSPLNETDVGAEVAVLFEQGDPGRPLVIAAMHRTVPTEPPPTAPGRPGGVALQLDGERLVLCAEREVVLACGQASITLTRAGKILLQGTYVVSRASGVNRIKGGSVQIN